MRRSHQRDRAIRYTYCLLVKATVGVFFDFFSSLVYYFIAEYGKW